MTVPGKELLFLALGGSGEIGMNANLYGCDGKWIMLDLGVTFGRQDYPGIDIVCPPPHSSRHSRTLCPASYRPPGQEILWAATPAHPPYQDIPSTPNCHPQERTANSWTQK